MNGREKITDYNGGFPFELYREDSNKKNNYNHRETLMGIHEKNDVNSIFFSSHNVNVIQDNIRKEVSRKSAGQFKIGKQSEQQLVIIMRSIYLQHGKNLPTDTQKQVNDLNTKVLEYTTPNIITNIKQHIGFVNDVNAPPSLPIVPKSTRIYNNTLQYNIGLTPYQK